MDFQGSAGQNANGNKTSAVGPTGRLVLQAWIHGIFMIFMDFQRSAGQSANGYKSPSAGPTRRLVIQAWTHGFS